MSDTVNGQITVRVSAPLKRLGSAAAESVGTFDVYGTGLVRVWSPAATGSSSPSSGMLFFSTI